MTAPHFALVETGNPWPDYEECRCGVGRTHGKGAQEALGADLTADRSEGDER